MGFPVSYIWSEFQNANCPCMGPKLRVGVAVADWPEVELL